ncbi:hypothetical protein TREES_T100021049 [Tupaia chinensis]|uniref:Uncharacterized protein n=1 Tax=Tupaia chinensis TaxID=246437 RepID=L9JB25_TUPCH|nr:hypothetical protein TREES_T100021049 [Tupaia chinensis]
MTARPPYLMAGARSSPAPFRTLSRTKPCSQWVPPLSFGSKAKAELYNQLSRKLGTRPDGAHGKAVPTFISTFHARRTGRPWAERFLNPSSQNTMTRTLQPDSVSPGPSPTSEVRIATGSHAQSTAPTAHSPRPLQEAGHCFAMKQFGGDTVLGQGLPGTLLLVTGVEARSPVAVGYHKLKIKFPEDDQALTRLHRSAAAPETVNTRRSKRVGHTEQSAGSLLHSGNMADLEAGRPTGPRGLQEEDCPGSRPGRALTRTPLGGPSPEPQYRRHPGRRQLDHQAVCHSGRWRSPAVVPNGSFG